MSSTQGRWVFFLAGVVCAIWLLAVHAFLDHLLRHWPAEAVATDASPCERSKDEQTWKLRNHPGVPPIEATTMALPDGAWGLLLCGVHENDVLFDKGFRHGDLLVEVDGWRPSTPRAALASYGRILADEVGEVEVERGNKRITLTTNRIRPSTLSCPEHLQPNEASPRRHHAAHRRSGARGSARGRPGLIRPRSGLDERPRSGASAGLSAGR